MQVTVNAVVVCVKQGDEYEKNGRKTRWRELWLSQSMTEAPTVVRVDDRDPAALDAFNELLKAEWLATVPVMLRFDTFGREKTQSVSLVGLPAPVGK